MEAVAHDNQSVWKQNGSQEEIQLMNSFCHETNWTKGGGGNKIGPICSHLLHEAEQNKMFVCLVFKTAFSETVQRRGIKRLT